MKVKMLSNYADGKKAYHEGNIVELSDDEGEALIDIGAAELVKEKAKKAEPAKEGDSEEREEQVEEAVSGSKREKAVKRGK